MTTSSARRRIIRSLLADHEITSQNDIVALLADLPGVRSVRGRGLLVAAQLEEDRAGEVVQRALAEQKLVVNAVRPDAIRFAPPLTVTPDEVGEAVTRLAAALEKP